MDKLLHTLRLIKTTSAAALLGALFGFDTWFLSGDYLSLGIIGGVIAFGIAFPLQWRVFAPKPRLLVVSNDVAAFLAGRHPPREDE